MLTLMWQTFIRVRVLVNFYMTLALVFQVHIHVGCGDLQ